MTKTSLGWLGWISALIQLVNEILFQKIYTSRLPLRFPLPVLTGLNCIVTGATSGIGLETAKQLAEAGAHVVLACRNTAAAQNLVQNWQNERDVNSSPLNVEVMELNLLSLSSVRSFGAAWEARHAPLHLLINNAGIFSMSAPQKFSEDGYEEHLQVNHLAPALLTMSVLPSLFRGAPSRIVNVNSEMQSLGIVDPDDLNITSGRRKYSSARAYSGSKLAQIYFSSVLERQLPVDAGIHVICVNPGIVKTNVTRTLPNYLQAAYRLLGFFSFNSVAGARSVLYCATNPEVPEYGRISRAKGCCVCPCYSSECKPKVLPRQAHNEEVAFKVWEKTTEAIGLSKQFLEKVLIGEDVSLIDDNGLGISLLQHAI